MSLVTADRRKYTDYATRTLKKLITLSVSFLSAKKTTTLHINNMEIYQSNSFIYTTTVATEHQIQFIFDNCYYINYVTFYILFSSIVLTKETTSLPINEMK